MRYFVVTDNGQKYGPADLPTLNQWIAEGRVIPSTILEDEGSGVRMAASTLSGLEFGAPTMTQTPPYGGPSVGAPSASGPLAGGYPRPGSAPADNGQSDMTQAWVFGALCLGNITVFCSPLCGGLSILFGILGLLAAIRAEAKGHPQAKTAKIFNIVVLVLHVVFFGSMFRIWGH